ncbi:phage major capsid protein [Methylocella sp.]|uniref:phage major capsid protein n=1 Tax=Methylocella sp. TaxID=1978226 RepID=UPI0037846BE4
MAERLSALTAAIDAEARARDYARWLVALSVSNGDSIGATQVFNTRWPGAANRGTVHKAATSPTSSAAMTELSTLAGGFIETLRPATIIGKLTAPRRVPVNIRVPSATSGASVTWAGAAAPAMVSSMAFAEITLPPLKISGIVALTRELLRSTAPEAEALIDADLRAGVVAFEDKALLDPAAAGVVGVSPASVTYGAPTITASGTDADALKVDLAAAWATLAADPVAPTFIMRPTTAMGCARALGATAPDLGWSGGRLFGVPVVTSSSAPASTIIILDAAALLVADGGVEIDMAGNATIELAAPPSNPPVAATVMTSLWQSGLVGLRAVRGINWAMARPNAVALLTGASYS